MRIQSLRKRIIYIFLFVIFILIIIVRFFININKPIIIGFSAQLTGKQAELGIQERNGVELAVETINSAGGINGHKIELKIKDDFGVPEKAKFADEELIKEGAAAIVGHATSSQTLAALEVTEPNKVILIGPTVSTPKLSGIDDYFFRVTPSFQESSRAFAKYLFENKNIHKIAVVYDVNNEAYSKTYSSIFLEKFEELGGTVVEEESFSSIEKWGINDVVPKLCDSKPDGVLIIASDSDTAFIAQKIRLKVYNMPLFTTDWSQTENLVKAGGKAVEGMILPQTYLLNCELEAFKDFQSRYKSRFGSDPSFGASFGYEAAMILAEALKKTGGNSKGLKDALLQVRDFKGIINDFSFDKYGDVHRPVYLSTVENGKFVVIGQATE